MSEIDDERKLYEEYAPAMRHERNLMGDTNGEWKRREAAL